MLGLVYQLEVVDAGSCLLACDIPIRAGADPAWLTVS